MIWYSYVLLAVPLMEVSGQRRNDFQEEHNTGLRRHSNTKRQASPDRSAELLQIQKDMENVSQETDKLNAESIELDKNIENIKTNCAKEVTVLGRQHEAMMIKAEEHQKLLVELLRKIHIEEEEHVRLEGELKRLSDVLELTEHQHEIVLQDLNLMGRRRSNGTSERCTDLTATLAEEFEDRLLTRSHMSNPYKTRKRKSSDQDNQLIVMKNKLKIKTILKNKILGSVESSKKEFQAELEQCNGKKNNVHALIEETARALETSAQSVLLFQNDLQEAVTFSEAVRLEIKTGRDFLFELREKVNGMKKATESFTEDFVCFNKIKSMD